MIDSLIQYVVSELNAYLNLRSPTLTGDRLVAGSLFDLDGQVNAHTRDKVVLSLVNVQKDPVYHSVNIYDRRPDNGSELIKPEIKINLFLLFVANLVNYAESAKALGYVIAYFQHRDVIDYAAIPSLTGREGRAVFDLHSMSFEEQNHLWGALGAKYLPSVMYKLGIIDIRDPQIEAELPPIRDIWLDEAPL